jgi:hypothetical protein
MRVIRKNAKIDVDGSGGLDVPVEFDNCTLLNGFLLGCAGMVYGGSPVSGVLLVLLVLLVLSLLVLAELDVGVPEPEADDEGGAIISNMYNLF